MDDRNRGYLIGALLVEGAATGDDDISLTRAFWTDLRI